MFPTKHHLLVEGLSVDVDVGERAIDTGDGRRPVVTPGRSVTARKNTHAWGCLHVHWLMECTHTHTHTTSALSTAWR